jgi:alanyl-tRNA synthetase
MVKLLSEASIGAGVRRVEALVGLDAFRYLAREHVLVNELAGEFRARPEELPDRIAATLERLKAAEKELEHLRAAAVLASAGELAASAEPVGAAQVVTAEAPAGVGGADLRSLALDVRGRLRRESPAVVILASPSDKPGGPVSFVVAVSEAGQQAGLAAGDVVKVFAPVLGARGGGKADLAQGAGGDVAKLADAFAAARAHIAQHDER